MSEKVDVYVSYDFPNFIMDEISLRRMIEFGHYIDWFYVSTNYNLSENFMEDYIDALDKIQISLHQRMNLDFIKKHFLKLDCRFLLKNIHLSEDVKKEIIKEHEKLELLKDII